jgi:hypothetical protein
LTIIAEKEILMDSEQRAATLARIDERTEAILTRMDQHVKAFEAHEERDRQDFKDVNKRIGAVERKQNWMIGVGTTAVFCIGIVLGIVRKVFTGGV